MFANSISPDPIDTVCNTPKTQLFPNNGVQLNFNYYDRDYAPRTLRIAA